jgi:hypothetical protein
MINYVSFCTVSEKKMHIMAVTGAYLRNMKRPRAALRAP